MESAIYRLPGSALQLTAMQRVEWTLADVIVKLRKQRGWGRDELAAHAHVSYMTVTRLETGKEMKEASIRSVAGALDLTLAELYALVPRAQAVDAETRELDRVWRAVPVASRPTVLDVLRSYAPAPPDTSQSPTPLPTPATEATTIKNNPRKRRA